MAARKEDRRPIGTAGAPPRRRLRIAARWLLRLLAIVLVIGLVPLVLTFVYARPSVHPVSTLMIRDTLTFREHDRRWMPIGDMGPHIAPSVLMSEDGQFCMHRGIDWGALKQEVDAAIAGEPVRGASTIPMQTVKNLFLWHGRSYVRKALELPLAVYFDYFVPKRRIMEIYLNIAEWGPGVYGAEAAARHHFGVSVKSLSRRQAALLAVTLPNPQMRDPARPSRAMNRLANRIERLAARSGDYIRCLEPGRPW